MFLVEQFCGKTNMDWRLHLSCLGYPSHDLQVEILSSYRGLIYSAAKKTCGRFTTIATGLDMDDCWNGAAYFVLEHLEKWDPNKATFNSYVYCYARYGSLHLIREAATIPADSWYRLLRYNKQKSFGIPIDELNIDRENECRLVMSYWQSSSALNQDKYDASSDIVDIGTKVGSKKAKGIPGEAIRVSNTSRAESDIDSRKIALKILGSITSHKARVAIFLFFFYGFNHEIIARYYKQSRARIGQIVYNNLPHAICKSLNIPLETLIDENDARVNLRVFDSCREVRSVVLELWSNLPEFYQQEIIKKFEFGHALKFCAEIMQKKPV